MAPFLLEDLEVFPDSNRIVCGGQERKVEPKVMALLVYLAQRANQVVAKKELLDEVWKGTVVVEEALLRAISVLRQTLGDRPESPRFIETIPKKGYRLLIAPAPLKAKPDDAPPRMKIDISPRVLFLALVIVGLAGYLVWEKFVAATLEPPAPRASP